MIMPELPEVQTTINYLEPSLVGKIISLITTSEKGKSHFNKDWNETKYLLKGAKIISLSRIGKWILIDLDKVKVISHLRMSGRYLVDHKTVDHPHNRFQLHLNDGAVVNYIDQRRFGTFQLLEKFSDHPTLSKLGPDALGDQFTPEYLFSQLQSRSKSIYSSLLDQNIIAGLGNIYVNEVLYITSIHPLIPSNTITRLQTSQLVKSTQKILRRALEFKGTTLIDNLYKDPEGNDGGFAEMLNVYGKKKTPEIKTIKIGGRTVFFDPKRQAP